MVGEPVAGQPAEVPVEPAAAQHVPGWACAACVKTSSAAASRMACFMRLWRLDDDATCFVCAGWGGGFRPREAAVEARKADLDPEADGARRRGPATAGADICR